MSLLVFDDLTTGTAVYFDDLDSAPGVAQQANAVIVMSAGGAQEADEAYEQPLDVTIQLYSDSPQEFVAPVGAGSYLQSGVITAVFYTGATQEFIPAQISSYVQQGAVTAIFIPAASQSWVAGAAPGDFLHWMTGEIVVLPAGAQQYLPITDAVNLLLSYGGIAKFKAANPSRASATFTPMTVRYVSAILDCQDAEFQSGLGPQGYPLRVELALIRNGVRTPLASVTAESPRADFYEDQSIETAIDALKLAAQDGELEIELGGYRALPDRSLPIAFDGPVALSVDLVP